MHFHVHNYHERCIHTHSLWFYECSVTLYNALLLCMYVCTYLLYMQALALDAARESMVLLKNDGVFLIHYTQHIVLYTILYIQYTYVIAP